MDQTIERVIEEGYSFSMGKYISRGWNIFKERSGSFIGFFWLSIILMYLGMFLIMLPMTAFIGSSSGFGSIMLIMVILILVMYVGIMPLFYGYLTFSKGVVDGDANFGMFFNAYKYIGQILVYNLIILAIMLPFYAILFAFGFPFESYLEMMQNPSRAAEIAQTMQYEMESNQMMFNILNYGTSFVSIVVQLLFALTLPLVIDRNMSVWQAMGVSRKVMGKKIFHFIGMGVLLYLIMVFGMLITCLLGSMVLIPLVFTINYGIYHEILGVKEDKVQNEIDSFGSSQSDINLESDENAS